jgi:aminoglycoside 6'-N-acetyltransferase I
MTNSVRKAGKADLRAWAAMRVELWPESGLKAMLEELKDMVRKPRFQGWIAMDGVEPIGFAEAYVREFANGCDSLPVPFLEGIWVKKSHRRIGVGATLIRAVETWATGQGFVEIGSDAYLKSRVSRSSHVGWGFEEMERVVYFRKKLKRRLGKPKRA